uniref:DUF5655 domain-containing protein n=1 Tax=Rhabditophanes sp. KR3021 TaxID=114890 RepID=A0AC35TZI3_9BILA
MGRYFEEELVNDRKSSEIQETKDNLTEIFNQEKTAANVLASIKGKEKDAKDCYVYLMVDPRAVHGNWSKFGVKKEFATLKKLMTLDVVLQEGRLYQRVIYDKSFGKKGVIVLKMKYQSKQVARNVASIRIDYLRPQLTNFDSGKSLFEEIYLMFPEINDKVADLILG